MRITKDGWRLQLAIVLAAGALWAVAPTASLLALLVAYAIAWLLLDRAFAHAPSWTRLALGGPPALALGILLAAGPIARGVERAGPLLEHERLDTIDHAVTARLRLERAPAIAPPLLAADRPQTFYVHAPDATRVRVRFDAGRPIEATALGHGLFRIEHDPRTDGAPDPHAERALVTITADGVDHEREVAAVTPAPHPRWLAPSPSRAAVATTSEETDELIVLDARGLVLRAPVDDGPTDAVFLDERRIAVSHRHRPSLLVVDAREGTILERVEVGPFAERLARIDGALAIARGGARPEVRVLDDARETAAIVPLPHRADWIAFGPDAGTLIAATRADAALHRFRRGADGYVEDARPLALGRPAVTLARSPDGRRLVVAVTDHRPGGGPAHLGNHYIDDQLLTIDVAAWRVVDARRTAARTSRQDHAGDVDRGVSPMGIDLQDDGAMLVAFAGTDDVWRLGASEMDASIVALDEHPLAAPFSAVALADRSFWVSSPTYGALGRFRVDGRHLATVRLAPDDRALLATDEAALQRRIGERTFYESTRAGVSCQSCHLHAESDGAPHNIGGNTLVATLDVRGLRGTPPYLRDGGYPLLGSLDELSQTLYRGYLRAQGGRRVSLDRYLSDLPRAIPYRQLEGRDLARERRGLDVFVRARCVLCHSFPAFTNLGGHPAEALFPRFAARHPGAELDTPSLFALDQSAPYLVDGRAPTLRSIFTEHDPDGRHGDTRGLSDTALDDLVYFLEGL